MASFLDIEEMNKQNLIQDKIRQKLQNIIKGFQNVMGQLRADAA